jgi:hypothetical protein
MYQTQDTELLEARPAKRTVREHMDDVEAIAQRVNELSTEFVTWHNISQWFARFILVVFFLFWLRELLRYIQPAFWYYNEQAQAWMTDINILLSGFVDFIFALGLAAGCAVLPSIFWSSLIASAPANALLNKLYRKYGTIGYGFALIGALAFTILSFIVMHDFWVDRPFVRAGIGDERLVIALSLATLFVTIGFPAWALNVMTPRQWVAAVTQVRHVARLDGIMRLEEILDGAIVARAYALTHAKVAKMTAAQFGDVVGEVAGFLAGSEKRIAESLGQVQGALNELYGFKLAVEPADAPDDIAMRYGLIVDVLTEAFQALANAGDDLDHYVELGARAPQLAAPGPESVTTARRDVARTTLQSQVRRRAPIAMALPATPTDTTAMAGVSGDKDADVIEVQQEVESPPPRLTPSDMQGRPSQTLSKTYYDHYVKARARQAGPWNVTDIQLACRLKERQAWRCIAAWVAADLARETEITGTYIWVECPT